LELLKFQKRAFTISELSKEAAVPFASAWRLVKKLDAAGIVETAKVGNCITVTLRPSSYLDSVVQILSLSKTPQSHVVGAIKKRLQKDKTADEAYLFGSVASGAETLSSDIDIAVLAKKGFDANSLVYWAYEKYGAKPVPIVFGSHEKLKKFLEGKNAERLK